MSAMNKESKKSLKVKNSAARNKAILSRMGQMVLQEEISRPRKSIDWSSDSLKPKIFKINYDDLTVNWPPSDSGFKQIHGFDKKSNTISKKSIKVGKSFSQQMSKYCKHSTLHGLKSVGDPHLSIVERIFWFISFLLVIAIACYYITNIYNKWKASPVIISFNPYDADLRSIPFPAVTICNMNRAKRSEAEKIEQEGSVIHKKLLDDACDGNSTFEKTQNVTWETLREFLVKVGNSCSDMLKWCQWGSEVVNCHDIWNNDLTDEGLCCSFNRLPPERIFKNWKEINILNQTYPSKNYAWDEEDGFAEHSDENSIPRRALGAGAHLGLSVILDAKIDDYYCSSTRSTGFKVDLSNPIDTAKVADFGILVSPGFEHKVAVEPYVREATDNLRGIPIEKRQCYFSNERPLQYYRSYTQRNCQLECQSKHTFSYCKCVPYYLPKNKTIKYCGKTEKQCVERTKREMETGGKGCHCLPACFSVKYPKSKSMAYLTDLVHYDFTNFSSEYFVKNIAVMHFYFYSITFTKELKSELYGFTEILSNTGGLLSLCMGFSFLSLVELIYHTSLRVACDAAKQRLKRTRITPVLQLK